MMLCLLPVLGLLVGHTDRLGPGDHRRFLEMDKQVRSFWVHVPPRYDPREPMPVVLALHGATMTAKSMQEFSGLNEKADAAGFIVVYPNGTGPNPLMFTWNSGGFSPALAAAKPNDVAFLARVLDDVEGAFNVNKKRVYATGMSNGAMMCYRLAAEMSERIAAIAPVGGTIAVEKYEPKVPMPVLHIHGTVDTLVPFDGPSAMVAAFMKFLPVEASIAACVKCCGCTATPTITELPRPKDAFKITRRVYDMGQSDSEVILYVVEGGGHTWPGRPFGGGVLGTYTMNMNANDVIWEFFSRHTR